MSVTNRRNATDSNVKIMSEFRMATYTATLSAALTIEKTFPPILLLDPGGAGRTITLPAEADSEGLVFIVGNMADAAEDLTVEDDGSTTIGTVSQNEMAMFVCDGTTWKSLVGANT